MSGFFVASMKKELLQFSSEVSHPFGDHYVRDSQVISGHYVISISQSSTTEALPLGTGATNANKLASLTGARQTFRLRWLNF